MSTSITTGMMNTPLANLARQSAIKTDPCSAPPPPDFRDDTSSDDAFSLGDASDIDSCDIQHIKPAAVKPTLDLKNVPSWDNTISTRDNAQAIQISLGSAGYLDTTKCKYYDYIVDITISAAIVNEKLATIISAGQNMEARKRLRQQRVRAYPPNLNYYNPGDPQHATRPDVVSRWCERPCHTQQQCVARRHANGLRILEDTTPTSTMNDPRYDRHQREPAERRVNASYGHNPRDNYNHQAPPGQHFYNNNRTNRDRLQRQQHWTNQGGNDGMPRHQQPVGFVSPVGHQNRGHQHANNNSNQRPTGHLEAFPFVGVSPSAHHHGSLPIMLTCPTAAP
eukprot:jgi/Tetstr1/449710/TSEL_036778.t1